MRLVVFLAQQRRRLAITEVGVHRGADREARDQAPAAEHVEHREFFGDTNRRIVQRDRLPSTTRLAREVRRARAAAMMFGEGIMP